MKRAIFILMVLSLALPAVPARGGTVYGSGVTVDPPTLVSDMMSRPDAYIAKTVKVKGLVLDVCETRGCWMELAGDKPGGKLRIKVEDGVIVFPQSARGRQAVVQGTVEMLRMCPEEAQRFRQIEAREKGVPFLREMVTGKESSLAIVATGAIIE
ncbi:MAG: DUF4920 domain-containing protein [bacterium]